MTYFKKLLGISVWLVCAHAHAGQLIDTDDNSFIDQSSGIEWLDFGVNNGLSFDYVVEQTQAGGIYEQWRLPTKQEVYQLFTSTFVGLGADFEQVDVDQIDIKSFHIDGVSVLDNLFAVMGFNLQIAVDYIDDDGNFYGGEHFLSAGMYQGSDGISYVNVFNSSMPAEFAQSEYDAVQLFDNQNFNNLATNEDWLFSTLLVRRTVDEPTSITIMLLALLAIAMRRQALSGANVS